MFGTRGVQDQNKRVFYPLLVSERLDYGNLSSEEMQAIWMRFSTLSDERKSVLLSDELPEKIEELQKQLSCDDSHIEGVSVLLRWFFFDEVDQAGLQAGLQDIFGEQAQKVFEFIQKEILTIKPKPRVEETDEEERGTIAKVKLPLLQALSKYENLGNQLITRERIRIKSQQEPVRPSLLYWIKYYRDELGIGHHNSVERGNFLFRSENGKQLSAEERERVNLVLKSVEENYPIDIDTERSEIVFPPFEPPRAAPPRSTPAAPAFAPAAPTFTPMAPAAPQPSRPNPMFHFGQGGVAGTPSIPKQAASGTLSFTSKHVFPAEKSAATPAPSVPPVPPAPAPASAAPRAVPLTPPKGNPFHIRPVSLGERDKGNES